jgi:ABC-type branched-subunit amino acid transport system permease subunit
MQLPSDIAFIVALLVSVMSNFLRSDGLPKAANAVIAIVAIVLIAGAIGWLTTGFTLDIKQDVLLIISIIVSLFTGLKELNDLLAYLQAANSPLQGSETP